MWHERKKEERKERNLFTPIKLYNKWTSHWGEWMWLYQEDAKQEIIWARYLARQQSAEKWKDLGYHYNKSGGIHIQNNNS